jgi:hypothetical protein
MRRHSGTLARAQARSRRAGLSWVSRNWSAAAGLSWPLPEEMTDAVLEAKLFADAGTKQGHRRQVEPDWASSYRPGPLVKSALRPKNLRWT